MTFSRRTALAALGVGTVTASVAAAPVNRKSGDQAELEQAIEALRQAMVNGDGVALDRLLHDRVDYMHSSGHSQSKAMLLSDLAGKKFFADLVYAERTILAIDRTGLVKLSVDQVKNLPGGKTRASRIIVQQVWAKAHLEWQLMARASAIVSSPIMPSCSLNQSS